MHSSWTLARLAVWTLVLTVPFHLTGQCKKITGGDVAPEVQQQIEHARTDHKEDVIDPLLMDEYLDYMGSYDDSHEEREKKYAQTPVCIESRCVDKILASYPHPTPVVVNPPRPSGSQYVKTVPIQPLPLPAIDPRATNDGNVEVDQEKSAISHRQTSADPTLKAAEYGHVVSHKDPEKGGANSHSGQSKAAAYSAQQGNGYSPANSGYQESQRGHGHGHPSSTNHHSSNYQPSSAQHQYGPPPAHPAYQPVYSQSPNAPYGYPHQPQGPYFPPPSYNTPPQQYSPPQPHQPIPAYQQSQPSQGSYPPSPSTYSSPIVQPPTETYNPPPQGNSKPQSYSPPQSPSQSAYSPSQPSSNYNPPSPPPASTYQPSSPSYSPPPSNSQYSPPPPPSYSQTKPSDHKSTQSGYSSGSGYSPAPVSVNNYSPPAAQYSPPQPVHPSSSSSGYSNSQSSYSPPSDQYNSPAPSAPSAPSSQQYSPPAAPTSNSKPYQPSSPSYAPSIEAPPSNYNPSPPSPSSQPQSSYNPPSNNYPPPPPSAPSSDYKPDQTPYSPAAPSYNPPPPQSPSYSSATTPPTYSPPHVAPPPITYKSVYGNNGDSSSSYREAATETSTSRTWIVATTATTAASRPKYSVDVGHKDEEKEPIVATFKEPFHYFGEIKPVDTSKGEEEYRTKGEQVQKIDIEIEEDPPKLPQERHQYEEHPQPNYYQPMPEYYPPPPQYHSTPHCDCSGNTFNFYQAPQPEPVYHENTCGHSLIFSCAPTVSPAPCSGDGGYGPGYEGDYGHHHQPEYHQPAPHYGHESHQPHSYPSPPQIEYQPPHQEYERQQHPGHPIKEPVRYKPAPESATTPQYRNPAEDEVKTEDKDVKKERNVGSNQAIIIQPGYTFGEDPAVIKAKVQEIEKPRPTTTTTTTTSSPLRNNAQYSFFPAAPFGSGLAFKQTEKPAAQKAEEKPSLLESLKNQLAQMGGGTIH